MRTLLRHTATGLYFQCPGGWTGQAERALDFGFIDRALQFVESAKLREVELAFAFEGSPQVTTVPLEMAQLRFAAD